MQRNWVFPRMGHLSAVFLGTALCHAVTAVVQCDKTEVPQQQDVTFKLKGSQLAFPCEATKQIYISTSRYIPKNIIITRFQIRKEEVFVALPRYKSGVPFTLGKFTLSKTKCNCPILEPFPSWVAQEEGNCEALQNVIDLVCDEWGTLWVLDTGICNTLEYPVRRCSPKLVGISIETGEIVKIIHLDQFTVLETRLQFLTLDHTPDGRRFAYITDAGAGAIIVIDTYFGTGHRMELPCSMDKGDVLYALLLKKPTGNELCFTYKGSPKVFSIKTLDLQFGKSAGVISLAATKPHGFDMVFLGTDNAAGIFFRPCKQRDIFLWNSTKPCAKESFVEAQKGSDLGFCTQVVSGPKNTVCTIESNFDDFVDDRVGSLGPYMVIHLFIKGDG